MAIAALRALQKYILREVLKDAPKGVMQTLPNKDLIELNVQVLAQRLMQNGIDPTRLKNANQVENAVKMIESRPTTGGVTSTKSAKVFDMEGKEIDPKKGIMGGKQIDDDLPPPGSRGDKDDIAAPVQSSEETIKNMIEAENKKNIFKMRKRKMVKDAIDNVSPGFVKGDRKYNAQLVAEELAEKKFGKEFYDLDQRQQNDLYDEALDGLSVDLEDFAQGGRAGFKDGLSPAMQKRMMELLMQGVPMDKVQKEAESQLRQEEFRSKAGPLLEAAQGGRAGFSKGKLVDLARRKFLKTAASVGAGIGALKTGLLGLGKQAAPMVEAAKETVTQAPSYFFDLVAKIKLFGKQRPTPSYKERVNEFTYTGKNGDQYELVEDLDTGEIMIQKDKMGVGVSGDKSFDTINDRTEMRYKKPKPDEGDPNPSEEYEEYKVEFDPDGTPADAVEIDEISKKEIIEEVTKDAPPIKKASGGIARMLGE